MRSLRTHSVDETVRNRHTHADDTGETSNARNGEECDSMTFSLGNLASKHLPYRHTSNRNKIPMYKITHYRTLRILETTQISIKGVCLEKTITHTHEVLYSQAKNEQDLYEH